MNLEQFIKPTDEIDEGLLERIEYNDMLFCIAETLIDYRDEFKYNQEDIAQKLNMTQVMISKIESGNNNISIKSLVKIWNKLSNKDYNFAQKVLSKMLKRVINNYDIRYNYGVYSATIKTDDKIFKFNSNKNVEGKYGGFKKYIKNISNSNGDYSSAI